MLRLSDEDTMVVVKMLIWSNPCDRRCQEIFGGDFSNVQPHSGAQANATAFLATLNPGDKILGMRLHTEGISHTVLR